MGVEAGIRERVREAYSSVAEAPGARHPFPVGRRFAEQVGYSADRLHALPKAAVDRFAGVSNVSLVAPLSDGARVLDLGCGAGLDTLIAATRVGPRGSVVAIDFSKAMLRRARSAAAAAGVANVDFRQASAERLPLADASIDVTIVNGLFNLNPARVSVLEEIARVLRPDGTLFAAELILTEEVPAENTSESDWFA